MRRSDRAAGALAAVLVLALPALGLAGCDIFQTRDPAPPSQTTSTFEPPVTPDAVLRNLQSAVAEDNVDNYMRCFVDTTFRPYLFVPSQDVRANFGVWTLDEERRYFRTMGLTTDGSPLLNLSIQNSTFFADSTYTITYALFFPHRQAGVPTFVRGNMLLHLAIDPQGRWAIDRWDDNRLPAATDSTWSYLKFWFNR
jgi:hypothetical protein